MTNFSAVSVGCIAWSAALFIYFMIESDTAKSLRGLMISVLFLIAAGVWR
jgi:hypothetical protein